MVNVLTLCQAFLISFFSSLIYFCFTHTDCTLVRKRIPHGGRQRRYMNHSSNYETELSSFTACCIISSKSFVTFLILSSYSLLDTIFAMRVVTLVSRRSKKNERRSHWCPIGSDDPIDVAISLHRGRGLVGVWIIIVSAIEEVIDYWLDVHFARSSSEEALCVSTHLLSVSQPLWMNFT